METTRKDSVTLYSEHQRWKPQERTLSHYFQSISDGNVEATASKRFFEERKCKQAPRPPPLLSRACLSFVLFLDRKPCGDEK